MSFFSKLVSIFQEDQPKNQVTINAFFNHKASQSESEEESDEENSSNENQSDEENQSEEEEEEQENESDQNDETEENQDESIIENQKNKKLQNAEQNYQSEDENNSSISCGSCKLKKQKSKLVSESESDEVQSDKEQELWYWNHKEQQQQKIQLLNENRNIALNCILKDENLIQLHYQQNYSEVLDEIYDPHIQLDYINFIWDEINDHKIFVRHIELLCKYSSDQVANFLRSGRYPIFDSLFFTKAYSIYEGTAVLLEMLNKLDECIAVYLDMLDELLRKYLREQLRLPVQISKKQKPYLTIASLQQLTVIFQHILGNIKQVLEKNRENQNVDILYFSLFNKIIDWQQMLNQVYYLDKSKIEVLSIINYFRQKTPEILIKLLYSTEIELFLDELINNYSKLRLGVQFYGFRQAFLDFQCFINILKLGNLEIIKHICQVSEQLKQKRNLGILIENICQKCLNKLYVEAVQENDKSIIMSCSHVYHVACIEDKTCNICSQLLIYEIINIKQKNTKQIQKLKSIEKQDFRSNEIEAKKNQIKPQKLEQQFDLKQFKQEKLKFFDKNRYNKIIEFL